jgi:hypothetical protein
MTLSNKEPKAGKGKQGIERREHLKAKDRPESVFEQMHVGILIIERPAGRVLALWEDMVGVGGGQGVDVILYPPQWRDGRRGWTRT